MRWRDGVHVTGTMLWFDAQRSRDLCVVSSVDRLRRVVAHGQMIATRETLALLGRQQAGDLMPPLRRAFTIGNTRMELVPSGYCLGSAAIFVEAPRAQRVLCAGPVSPRGAGLAEPAELRRCDVLVLDIPYAERWHKFPSAIDAAAAVADWALACATRAVPVVYVGHLGKGIDAVHLLQSVGLAVRVHPALAAALSRLAVAGIAAPVAKALRKTATVTEAVVWPYAERHRLLPLLAGVAANHLLASGRAAEPSARERYAVDHAIAWSSAGDREQTLALVRSSGATSVFLTGQGANAAAGALGKGAQVLAPPQQMSLALQ